MSDASIYRIDSKAQGRDSNGELIEKPFFMWVVQENFGSFHAAIDLLTDLGCEHRAHHFGHGQLQNVEADQYGIYQITMTVVRDRWDVKEVTMTLVLPYASAMEDIRELGETLGAVTTITRWSQVHDTDHIKNYRMRMVA